MHCIKIPWIVKFAKTKLFGARFIFLKIFFNNFENQLVCQFSTKSKSFQTHFLNLVPRGVNKLLPF